MGYKNLWTDFTTVKTKYQNLFECFILAPIEKTRAALFGLPYFSYTTFKKLLLEAAVAIGSLKIFQHV